MSSWSKRPTKNRKCHKDAYLLPKDAYLLPNIDRLVDGSFGFQVLSFLDAYSRYNQIRMHTPDEEKTTFNTKDANFFYMVISFGLKNASPTYQRLMD